MTGPSDILLLVLPLPLLAALVFAFFPAPRAALPSLAAAVSYVYAALAVLAGALAMTSERGLSLAAPALSVGVSGFELTPRFYLDGRNALFLVMLGLCLPVAFTLLRDREGRYGRLHYACAFALTFSLAGVFTSDSLLIWYFFWEAALVSVYFWIGRYGRPGFHVGEVYPVLLRFVLFTLAGSLPMLVSIAAVCAADFRDPGLSGLAAAAAKLSGSARAWVFGGFLLGFAVKLPLLGFHGWLRDTYNAAPPVCRALLSAAMSKMGAYGLILILAPCFPEEMARFGTHLRLLAVLGVAYGALLTMAQERLIDILAYGSLSHLSLLALGVFAGAGGGDTATTGLAGAVLLAFNHGLITVLLFSLDARVLVGGESPDKGLAAGLRAGQQRLPAILLVAIFASASLPGLGNFVGEILVLFAAFRVSPVQALGAALAALIAAAALLRAFHALFLGTPLQGRPQARLAPDLNGAETGLSLSMAAVWLAAGLYPMLLLRPLEKALLYLNAPGWTG